MGKHLEVCLPLSLVNSKVVTYTAIGDLVLCSSTFLRCTYLIVVYPSPVEILPWFFLQRMILLLCLNGQMLYFVLVLL